MKKSAFLFILMISILISFSCSKNTKKNEIAEDDSSVNSWDITESSIYDDVQEEREKGLPYEYIANNFILDYSPLMPEDPLPAGKIQQKYPEAKGEKSTPHIPGLRDISSYKTKYDPKKPSAKPPAVKKADNTGKSSRKKGAKDPLVVKNWGPGTALDYTGGSVQFYVEFSNSIVSLSALRTPEEIDAAAAKIFTIDPPVKGKYRFDSTKQVSFYAESSSVELYKPYKIKVSSDLTDISGTKISGTTEFLQKNYPIKMTNVYGGTKPEDGSVYYYDVHSDDFEERQCYARIDMNQKVKQSTFEKSLTVTFSKELDSKRVGFSVLKNNGDKTYYIKINNVEREGELKFKYHDKDLDKESTGRYETRKPPLPVYVRASIDPESVSEEEYDKGLFYMTSDRDDTSWAATRRSWRFEFSDYVDRDTLLDGFKVAGENLTRDNFYSYGSTVYLQYFNVKPGETKTIVITRDLKSSSGKSLDKEYEIYVEGRDFPGYARFIASGNKMLEAQFAPKLVFEYMNATRGGYKIQSYDDPMGTPNTDGVRNTINSGNVTKGIETGITNTRRFEEIDLKPYLNAEGKGTVNFSASVDYLEYKYDGTRSSSWNSNDLTVTVTDLGATVRVGQNRVLVWVTSLSTGKAIEGAVCNIHGGIYHDSVTTDKTGLAVFEFDENAGFNEGYYYSDRPTVDVSYKNDYISFAVYGHNKWANGVVSGSLSSAFDTYSDVYMFCDRGIYKPGETVTFRGIQWNRTVGVYRPASKYYYDIYLKNSSWYDDNTYGFMEGLTTENGGFYGSFVLPQDMDPGIYSIVYNTSDGRSFRLNFNVEIFAKLKTQAEVTFAPEEVFRGETLVGAVDASYLAGGYLAGAEYTADWYTQPLRFRCDGDPALSKYSFGICDDYEYIRHVSSSYGTLDGAGHADIECDSSGNLKDVPYVYKLETAITDSGNERIVRSQTKIVNSSKFYIGLKRYKNGFIKRGESMDFGYVLVSPDKKIIDNPSLIGSEITYELTREYWSKEYQSGVYGYINENYSRHTETVDTGSIKAKASGKFSIIPEKSGWHTLSVTIKDKDGRITSAEKEFYVTGGESYWWYGRGDSIKLTPDQSVYNPGQTAQILMESPLPKGDYLITVEREGIFTQEIRHFDESTSVIDVKIARNFVPVAYVTVSSFSVRSGEPTHEYGEEDLDKPKGYFGVTPIFIDPMVKAFTVKAEFDKPTYAPGENVTIKFTATKGGEPVPGAELTVMGVDRAVLDVINYHVPSPIEHFYSKDKFPMCTIGGDSRYYLMDPVTYSIKNLQGGDSDEGEKDDDERKDFRPTAFFEPYLMTGEDGTVTYSFKLPDSLTTYRLTAFGVKDDLLALNEDEFIVQNLINVQSVSVLQMRTRDTAETGVLLTNLDTKAHKLKVSAKIRQPLSDYKEDVDAGLTTVKGNAFIDGVSECIVSVASGDTIPAYFDVCAASDGWFEVVYTVEDADGGDFKDKLVCPIKVKTDYVYESVVSAGEADSSDNGEEYIAIPSFAKDKVGSLEVTLDATRLGLLSSSVHYLFDYPYGCLEQQSSRVLPLVIFGDYIELLGMNSKVVDPKSAVVHFTKNWKKYQKDDGGFRYWPESSWEMSNPYVSLRVAHIYALALKNGYKRSDIPIDINRLKRYLLSSIGEIVTSREEYGWSSTWLKAYAGYVFALLGERDSTVVSWLDSAYRAPDTDFTEYAYLGLAYYYMGNKEKAQACADNVTMHLKPTARGVELTGSYYGYWYNTNAGVMGTIMQLLVLLDKDNQMCDRLLFSLLQDMKTGYWTSTDTTVKVLEAINTFIRARNLTALDLTAVVDLNGTELMNEKFKGVGAKPVTKTFEFTNQKLSGLEPDKELPFNVNVKGKGKVYYTTKLTYAIPDEMQWARSEGFNITSKLYDYATDKEIVIQDDKEIQLESGRIYKMIVNVNSDSIRNYVALKINLPSGAEILKEDQLPSGAKKIVDNRYYDPDDRYYDWYWDDEWESRDTVFRFENHEDVFWNRFYQYDHSITVYFRAQRRGVYPTPPITCECMYESEIFGRTDGRLYTIK